MDQFITSCKARNLCGFHSSKARLSITSSLKTVPGDAKASTNYAKEQGVRQKGLAKTNLGR